MSRTPLQAGRPSRLEVGDFLVRDANGPQHAELLRLIGTLVDNINEGGTADPMIVSWPQRITAALTSMDDVSIQTGAS